MKNSVIRVAVADGGPRLGMNREQVEAGRFTTKETLKYYEKKGLDNLQGP